MTVCQLYSFSTQYLTRICIHMENFQKKCLDQTSNLSKFLSPRAKILRIGEQGWDQAIQSFNVDSKLQVPLYIVKCACQQDVSACIVYCLQNNLPITPRSGCHNLGNFSLITGGLVVDVRSLKNISYSIEKKSITYGAGCTFEDVRNFMQLNLPGYTIIQAMDKRIGIVGTRTTVGVGYLQRFLGNGIDSLLSAKIALADGRIINSSQEQNLDLFYCIKGAGSNFGIITQLTETIYEILDPNQGAQINYSIVYYDIEHAEKIFKKIYQLYELKILREKALIVPTLMNLAQNVVLSVQLVQFKYDSESKTIDLNPSQAQIVLRQLQKIYSGKSLNSYSNQQNGWCYIKHNQLMTSAPWNLSFYPRGGFVQDKNGQQVIKILIQSWKSKQIPLCSSHYTPFYFFGGQKQRKRDQDKSVWPGNQDTSFLCVTWASWANLNDKNNVILGVKNQWQKVLPKLQFGYVNGAGFDCKSRHWAQFIYKDKYSTIEAIKSVYDPQNLFKHNVNIPPK